jgi:hypothetical protein
MRGGREGSRECEDGREGRISKDGGGRRVNTRE